MYWQGSRGVYCLVAPDYGYREWCAFLPWSPHKKRFPPHFLPARILPGLCLGPSSSQPHGGRPQPDPVALLLRRPAPRHRYEEVAECSFFLA